MTSRFKSREYRKTSKNYSPYGYLVFLLVFSSIAFVVLIGLVVHPNSHLALATEPYEDLDPIQNPTSVSEAQALRIFLTSNVVLSNWRPPMGNQTDNEPFTPTIDEPVIKLVKDNMRGYIHWEVANASHSVWIDANTAEILHYNGVNYNNGSFSQSEAITLAQQKASEFAILPQDVAFHEVILKNLVENVDVDGSYPPVNTSSYPVYIVRFTRFLENVPSHDYICVILSSAGELILYDKAYTLTMPTGINPSIPKEEAENIAKGVFNGTVISTTLEIVRPNYFWSGGPYYGNHNGKLAWVVNLVSEAGVEATVWIDAADSAIVGGDRSL